MRRQSVWLMAVLLIILVFGSTAFAQLDVLAPFLNQEVGDYYIKARIRSTDYPAGAIDPEAIIEMYLKDDLRVTRTELFGQVFELAMEEMWTPETNLDLFYANYEVRIVGMEEAAGRRGFVVELFRKRDQKLRQTYVIDQDTGLVLNQYSYDLDGNLAQGYEAIEVDYDPDFSTIDLDNIQFEISTDHRPLKRGEFGAILPWINLDHLPLPEGFTIIAYSEVSSAWHRETPSWLENHRGLPVAAYWIWVSDGFEAIVIEVFTARGEDRIVKPESLELVDASPGRKVAVLPGQPASLQVQSGILTRPQMEALMLALTGAQEIENLETWNGTQPFHISVHEPIDYASLPRESISADEFRRLNPWIRLSDVKKPAGFTVTGLFEVTYPGDVKERFTLHQEHPEREILDFVVELSDGERLHYISVSFAPNFHEERLFGTSVSYSGLNTIELVAKGPLFSIYSESRLVSEEDQIIIVRELFPWLGFGERPR